jgi:hypothetical protein
MKKYVAKRECDRHALCGVLPILLAIFMAIASVVYIIYRCWDNKTYAEKWKDYENCGRDCE